MDRAWLHEQLAGGRSIESLARETGRDPSTVAYWVAKHGLASMHAPKHAARGGIARDELEPLVTAGLSVRAIAERLGVSYTTVRHWLKKYGLKTRGAVKPPRARRARSSATARIEEAGGACQRCGYDRVPAALQFHHMDPSQKAFELSQRGAAIALDAARAEVAKCVLLCANCHAEVEAGAATVR
jgi:DNA-binding transcriptional ArsR family regulator